MNIKSVLLTALRIVVYGSIALVVERLTGIGFVTFVASGLTLLGERYLASR